MNKKKYSEEELIQSLKKMPEFSDARSKEEIFQNIEQRLRPQKTNNNKKKWFVSVVTSAAAIAFLLFVPLEKNNITEPLQSLDDTNINNIDDPPSIADDGRMGINSTGISGASIKSDVTLSNGAQKEYPGVLVKYKSNKLVVTIPISDDQAQVVIPITFIMDANALMNDADLYNALNQKLVTMPNYLSKFLLHDARFWLGDDGSTLNIDVNENHQYDEGSATVMMFYETIESLLNYSYFDKATFSTNGKPGIALDDVGMIYEIKQKERSSGYFLHEDKRNKKKYLVPVHYSGLTFEEMIHQMSLTDLSKNVTASIPSGLIKSVEANGSTAVIVLEENNKLLEMKDNIQVIDAILMTAKEYGYESVLFKGLPPGIHTIGVYQLNGIIDVPLRPNGIIIN